MASARLESLKRLAMARHRMRGPAIVRPLRGDHKRPDGDAMDGVPVDPTRPGSLDGGAAAALEFDA